MPATAIINKGQEKMDELTLPLEKRLSIYGFFSVHDTRLKILFC